MASKIVIDKSADTKLSVWEKMCYGAGNTGFNVIFGITIAFLNFFWTDILLIPATMTGTFLMVSKIWDAINDPLIGSYADRKAMQGGSYRKWLWNFIPTIVVCVLSFVVLPGVSMTVQLVFSFGMYFIYVLMDTLYQVPHVSLMSTMTTNYKERGSLTAYRQTGGNITMFLVTTQFLTIAGFFGKGDPKAGFTMTVLVFCAITIPFFTMSVLGVKERVVAEENAEKIPFMESIRCLKGNMPAWMVILAHMCWGIQGGLGSAKMYFWTYLYGDMAGFSVNSMYGSIGLLISGFAVGFLVRRVRNKRNICMVAWACSAFTYGCMSFVDVRTNVTLFNVLTLLNGMCGQIGFITCLSLIPDCTEYTQLHYGLRTSGLIYSYCNFMFKLCNALFSGLFLMVIGKMGYVPGAVQPQGILTMCRLSLTAFPGIAMAIGILFFYLYKIDPDSHKATLSELGKEL